jgi:hypothetical protein
MRTRWKTGAGSAPKTHAPVARAVQRWAETGQGLVIAAGDEAGVFRLLVGDHIVSFVIDDATDTMHILQVRRA